MLVVVTHNGGARRRWESYVVSCCWFVVDQDLFITLMFESDAAVGRRVNRECSCTLAGILCTLDVVDKPARLISRFLFGFDKLNQIYKY